LRSQSLDWYYDLLQRAPSKLGELKSSDVTNTFLSLPRSAGLKVLRTLKFVRVNITDPRPYRASWDAIIGSIIPGVSAEEFMRRLENAKRDAAERIRRKSRRATAEWLLLDSPSERLRRRHRALTRFVDPPYWARPDVTQQHSVEPSLDLTAFADKNAMVNVNRVSVFVAKSGSVFYPALDEMDVASQKIEGLATAWDFWGVHRVLNESHAFDDGNRQAIDWVDDQRSELL